MDRGFFADFEGLERGFYGFSGLERIFASDLEHVGDFLLEAKTRSFFVNFCVFEGA